ncbi:MAG: hypothetical protein ACFFCW_48360 [Candidatus Hodarchaeota archaeon]
MMEGNDSRIEGRAAMALPFYFKMLSIIGGQAKIIDMRKKSCIYVGLRKFKDTVRNRSPFGFPGASRIALGRIQH